MTGRRRRTSGVGGGGGGRDDDVVVEGERAREEKEIDARRLGVARTGDGQIGCGSGSDEARCMHRTRRAREVCEIGALWEAKGSAAPKEG